jgi:hypothetical protein
MDHHHNEGRLNALYLIGTALVHIGAIIQIWKIFNTGSAEDISALWIGAILFGHLLHVPRSFTSEFWVWKLNCTVGLILCSIILGQVIHHG